MTPGQDALLKVDAVRPYVARDVAADIVGLLAGPARLPVDDTERPVRPGDVAVLVHTQQGRPATSATPSRPRGCRWC